MPGFTAHFNYSRYLVNRVKDGLLEAVCKVTKGLHVGSHFLSNRFMLKCLIVGHIVRKLTGIQRGEHTTLKCTCSYCVILATQINIVMS